MAKQNQSTPAQGAEGSTDNKDLFNHVVTQVDLDNNPDLVKEGVKVGETIQVPVNDENIQGDSKLVQAVLESNEKVLESNAKLADQNQVVIDLLEDFKENSADFVKKLVEGTNEKNQPIIDSLKSAVDAITVAGIPSGTGTLSDFKPAKIQVNPDSEYVVTAGSSFADKNDITKKYTSGEYVTHLGSERLQSLLDQGLIEEA